MQFKTALVALFAAAASAQDISQIPFCALSCFVSNAGSSGCSSVFDFACLCRSTSYFNAVQTCTLGSCNAADQAKTRTWAEGTCRSVGAPLPGTK